MAINLTTDKKTRNINKSAELKTEDGTVIGILSYNTTNQEYSGINFNVNITNKDLLVADAETYKTDIVSFLDSFVSETLDVMGIDEEQGE